jgi:peptidylprolyl isomerase
MKTVETPTLYFQFCMQAFKYWLQATFTALLVFALSFHFSVPALAANNLRESRMPQGNAITNPQALLRYSLPIDNTAIRNLQDYVEDIATQLRANRRWTGIQEDLKKAQRIVSSKQDQLLASIPEAKHADAESLLAQIQDGLTQVEAAVAVKDKEQTRRGRAQLLAQIGQLEALMVGEFPFEVPEEYSHLPQLKGRATIEIATTQGTMMAIVDGYSSPVTAGNFVDLVQRGFYDNLPFVRAEESYVLQAGDPPGPEDGFVDPSTKKVRTIPLEIKLRSQVKPIYGATLDEVGLYREATSLPFSAYGTLAMAHPDVQPNAGSSQFFLFLFEPELTPAGLNLLDGNYTVFGYVVEGEDVLRELTKKDKIVSMKVIQGSENLVQP